MKETNNNVNKCNHIVDKCNHIASMKREIKKKSIEHNSDVEANTSSQAGKIFHGENESLVPKIEEPSSHAVSLSGNDSSYSSSLLGNCTLISHYLLRLFFFCLFVFFGFFCCSLKSEISKLSGSHS